MSLQRDIENWYEDYGGVLHLAISALTLYLVWQSRK